MTATVVSELTDLHLAEPLAACYFCRHNLPEWVIRYDACAHFHLACGRCQARIEQRQQVADQATPPRPYAARHLCCGARIYRATWRRL